MSEPVDVGCPHGHVWTEWWSLPDGTDHRACGQCGWVQRRPDGGTWTDAVVIDRATAVIAAETCERVTAYLTARADTHVALNDDTMDAGKQWDAIVTRYLGTSAAIHALDQQAVRDTAAAIRAGLVG